MLPSPSFTVFNSFYAFTQYHLNNVTIYIKSLLLISSYVRNFVPALEAFPFHALYNMYPTTISILNDAR